ncbi:hypothetical protein [Actinokineospora enzanensis]|uniref:hypothetical protein n=1 Tax=Actinokineospora enzanensis TaxID=155975 RepID=UPI00038175F3|nr:hypothetical protein [Actinokineospora enzanensis]
MSVDTRWDKAVRAAIEALAPRRGGWVGLVDLRPALAGTSRAAQDRHLVRMLRERKIHLVPESNRKALTPAARAAAIRIGNEDNHLITWNHHNHT